MTVKKTKEERLRERYEVMTVRLARHLKLSVAEKYEDLPGTVKSTFCRLTYNEIALPLMVFDKEVNGLSLRQLEIKYGIPRSTIQYHLKK